jgi:hypothetical protein
MKFLLLQILFLLCVNQIAIGADEARQKLKVETSSRPGALPADAIRLFLLRWSKEKISDEPYVCLLWGPLPVVTPTIPVVDIVDHASSRARVDQGLLQI